MKMKGVTEYAEGMPVELVQTTGAFVSLSAANKGAGRWVVKAKNEAGHNCTEVDVLELVDWLRKHRPDLMANVELTGDTKAQLLGRPAEPKA